MMRLGAMTNSTTGFEAGASNYAQAAWNKTIRIPYDRVLNWMKRFESERDVVFQELYRFVFEERVK